MKLLSLSIVLLLLGYAGLYLVNDRADNIFGYVSPLLIVTGYAVFGIYLYQLDEHDKVKSGKEVEG